METFRNERQLCEFLSKMSNVRRIAAGFVTHLKVHDLCGKKRFFKLVKVFDWYQTDDGDVHTSKYFAKHGLLPPTAEPCGYHLLFAASDRLYEFDQTQELFVALWVGTGDFECTFTQSPSAVRDGLRRDCVTQSTTTLSSSERFFR